jgi:protein-tyrosine phosphatase
VRDVLPLVDIHCHLLPDLDDGAADWDESLAMARMAVADGISTIVATPHQLGNFGQNDGESIRARCAELQELLDRHGVDLELLPGADVRIEPELIARIRTGDVVTLADHRRHVLLELPHELYLPMEGLLADLRAAGLAGILSHPERNLGILRRPRIVESLVDAGCLMQVTAGSLAGTFGPRSKRLCETLVAEGLVHFIATDAHGSRSRRPLLSGAFDRVAALAGDEAAVELCSENPARVAAGHRVPAGRRRSKPRGLAGWFRKRGAA